MIKKPALPEPGSGWSLVATDQPQALRAMEPKAELLPPLQARGGVALDYLRTDETWDPERRTWRVSRSALRVSMPLHGLAAPMPLRRMAAAPRSLKLTWAATGIALAGSLALLLSAPSGRQPVAAVGSSLVDIPLDPAAPPRLQVVAAPAPADVPKQVSPLVDEPETPPAAALEAPLPSEAGPAPIDKFAAVGAAFAKAIDSGSAEPWEEAGLSGYVIVGPPALTGESVCRNVAIWLDREGGTGQVKDGQKCLAAGGEWVDEAPAAAPAPTPAEAPAD